MIYVLAGTCGDRYLVHAKTEVSHVAAGEFERRGQPYPKVLVTKFLRELYDTGGLSNVAAFFFEKVGDCVTLEEAGEVHTFFAGATKVLTAKEAN